MWFLLKNKKIETLFTRAGNSLIRFLSELLVFCEKWANERFAQKYERFAKKYERFANSLIFGEQPKGFAHGRSFLVCDMSDSLTSLIFYI